MMNKTKLPIRERIGNVPQFPVGVDAVVAEVMGFGTKFPTLVNPTLHSLFSIKAGLVRAQTASDAKVDAIVYVLQIIARKKFKDGTFVICSDSTEAIGLIEKEGESLLFTFGPVNGCNNLGVPNSRLFILFSCSYASFLSSCHYGGWSIPDEGFVKINIHFVSLVKPLLNGNINSVGTLVRDDRGERIWGAMSPMKGKTEMQATIWGFQSALVHLARIKCDKVIMETVNIECMTISDAGNKLWFRTRLRRVPDLEVYMDISDEEEKDFAYGKMNHMEVDQEAVPVLALENEVQVEEEVNPLVIVPYVTPSTLVPVIDKGKKRVYEDYALDDDGLLNQRAIEILEKGELRSFGKAFRKICVDLKEEVLEGFYVKGFLHHTVLGSLNDFLGSIAITLRQIKPVLRIDAA
ncbi:hypothetical protein AgCh_032734 [Apium graveolens]